MHGLFFFFLHGFPVLLPREAFRIHFGLNFCNIKVEVIVRFAQYMAERERSDGVITFEWDEQWHDDRLFERICTTFSSWFMLRSFLRVSRALEQDTKSPSNSRGAAGFNKDLQNFFPPSWSKSAKRPDCPTKDYPGMQLIPFSKSFGPGIFVPTCCFLRTPVR